MNKKTLRIAGWALGLSMAVAGIGVAVGSSAKELTEVTQVKADPVSFSLDASNFDKLTTGSGYAPYDGDHTIGDYTYTSSNVMVNSSALQFKKSSAGYLYNKTPFAENIASITITGASSLTVYVGTSRNPSTTALSYTGTGPFTYTPSGSYKYFKIVNGTGGAVSATSITFTLEEAADDSLIAKSPSFQLRAGGTLDLRTCVTAAGPNASHLTFEITDSGTDYASLGVDGYTLSGESVGNVPIHAYFSGTSPLIDCTFSVVIYELPTFTKITETSGLKLWSIYTIGNTNGTKAISATQGDNNRAAITSSNSATSSFAQTENEEIGEFLLVPGALNDTYAFVDISTGKALYAASSGSNYLRSQNAIDAEASFAITIDSGTASLIAQGNNTRNDVRYNDGNTCFSCYGSTTTQDPVSLFKSNRTLNLATSLLTANAFSFAAGIAGEVADQDADTGTCLTEYPTYKTLYNGYNGVNQAVIRYHTNSDITFARNRFQAWALYNEGSADKAWDGKTFSGSSAALVAPMESKTSVTPIIVGIIASVSALAVGGVLIAHKRKEER